MRDTDSVAPAVRTRGDAPTRLLTCAVATVALYLSARAFLIAECWALPLLALVLAWPLWSYEREQQLFGRRLILQGVTTTASWVKGRFWHGTISQALRVPAALIWGGVLVAASSQLRLTEWAILAVDALLLSLVLSPAIARLLAHQIAPSHLNTVVRRWPLFAVNIALLVAAFTAHDYWLGFPDTRSMAWNELAADAMRTGRESANCDVAGWLTGLMNLAQRLPRHAAMLLLPGLTSPIAKMLAWACFLGVTSVGGYLFTRLLLGAQTIAEARFDRGVTHDSTSLRDGPFVVMVLFLAGALFATGTQWRSIDFSVLKALPLRLAIGANPCRRELSNALPLQEGARREVDAASRAALAEAMGLVDRRLDETFAGAEKGVDAYLDWYFSYVGSYTRIASVIIPGIEDHMRRQFAEAIFEKSGFEKNLEGLVGDADTLLIERIAQKVEHIGRGLATQVEQQPCMREVLQTAPMHHLTRDVVRASLSGALAIPLSRTITKAAGLAGEAVLARAIARQSMKAAASAAGATAAKRGTSVVLSAGTAAAVCSAGGPLALACGAVAAVVTWIGVDVAMISIEEALFREKMKAEVIEELRAQRKLLKDSLQLQFEQASALYRAHAFGAVQGVFVPAHGS